MVIAKLIDFIIHVDSYIGQIIQSYGALTYLVLFAVIFIETGLVIMPLLPGDSLIFVAGAFAAGGSLNIVILIATLAIAAILGDSVNYWIGKYAGEKAFRNNRFFKKEYLDKTNAFYHKHGGKTIIIARFIPIIRTFAPFVAGMGKMDYKRFISFNIIGGIVWVLLFSLAGYFFGAIPWVEKNLTLVIFGIIFISILPPIIEYIRNKIRKN